MTSTACNVNSHLAGTVAVTASMDSESSVEIVASNYMTHYPFIAFKNGMVASLRVLTLMT